MPEYKITRISQDPPREWSNPKGGIIYYRKVMLEGHDRPVSIGKKNPDALQVGMTVYGTIEKTAMAEDKWHAEQNPNFSGGGSQGGQSGYSGTKGERQFKADPERQHSIEAQFAIRTALRYIEQAGFELTPASLKACAIDIFNMISDVKQGSTTSSEPQKSNVAQSTPTEEAVAQKQATRDWNSLHKGGGGDSFAPEDINLNDLFPGE